ncbi:hypothetical protein NL676_030528 [Syzygium grande]|nr:hypothetical protein NL676_030528 [Syzygium grande]
MIYACLGQEENVAFTGSKNVFDNHIMEDSQAETIRDYRLLISLHSLSLFFSLLKVLVQACSGSPLPDLAPLFASQLAEEDGLLFSLLGPLLPVNEVCPQLRF